MSRILPILFNTEMIRAILDGRKTCTRRIAKKVPKETYRIEEETQNGNLMFQCIWGGYMPDVQGFVDGYTNLSPPYQPGDILWVRETWCWCPCWDCGMDTEEGCCDKETDRIYHPDRREYGRYGWEANPWVWVIEFERIDRIVGGETNGQENSGTVHRCLCTDQGDGSGDSKVEEKERSNSGFCPGQ